MTTQQQQRNRYWSLKALSATRAELRIYGIIDTFKFFDEEGVVTPGEIAEELDAMGPDISAIDVFVNSPGGNVFAGQAIHSMLVRHRAEVTVTVDGLAASIASVIAMAGDRVLMPANALMMLHDPMALAFGNAAEMRKMASVLDTVREGMVEAYMRRWSGTRAALVEALQAETWYTAARRRR